MDKNNRTFLRLLVNRYHHRQSELLLKHLLPKVAEKVKALTIDADQIEPYLRRHEMLIGKVHYSWLVSPLKTFDTEKRALVLALLPQEVVSRLKDHFKEAQTPVELTPIGKKFFQALFLADLFPDAPLPITHIPKMKLSFLADMSKLELVELIDFLGLYDLAEELQYVLDKKVLEMMYKAIGKKRQFFLQKTLHQKEKMVSQRLKIEQWNGDEQTLLRLLHQKGMIRLGYALSGAHPDFTWYLSHLLDIGRGQKISEYCFKDAIPGVTETLSKQVINTAKFLKTGG